jgi:CHAD domain-containing protein
VNQSPTPIPIETWQFATQQVTQLLQRLTDQVNTTVASHGPDAVHDLRVAIRRFSQALVAFKQYFPNREVKDVRRELKVVMRLAGSARDCDVAIELLLKFGGPDATALRQKVEARREEAATELVKGLKRCVARNLFSNWRTALLPAQPPKSCSYPIVDDEARHQVPRIAKRFFKAGNRAADPKASPTEIHSFRIQGKKLRYTIELFQPVYGPIAETWLERLKDVQSLLGNINDCRVVRKLVAELGGSDSIETQLKKRQRKKTREFQKLWERHFSPAAIREWIHQMRMRRPRQATAP